MNQCMGCQAGWPVIPPRKVFGKFPRTFYMPTLHRVVGGYGSEVVRCTAPHLHPVEHDPGDEDVLR